MLPYSTLQLLVPPSTSPVQCFLLLHQPTSTSSNPLHTTLPTACRPHLSSTMLHSNCKYLLPPLQYNASSSFNSLHPHPVPLFILPYPQPTGHISPVQCFTPTVSTSSHLSSTMLPHPSAAYIHIQYPYSYYPTNSLQATSHLLILLLPSLPLNLTFLQLQLYNLSIPHVPPFPLPPLHPLPQSSSGTFTSSIYVAGHPTSCNSPPSPPHPVQPYIFSPSQVMPASPIPDASSKPKRGRTLTTKARAAVQGSSPKVPSNHLCIHYLAVTTPFALPAFLLAFLVIRFSSHLL